MNHASLYSVTGTRPQLEIADILREHGERYRLGHRLSPMQSKVLRRLVMCRTSALGGHADVCQACNVTRVSYNSCRDRHCPKCNASKQAAWLESRLSRLLPVPYFHVVFTLPEQLNALALKNQRVIYNLLFRAASQTLLELSANPKRLGAQIGFTAVLHTWGQNLLFHPHLHCVVTGGGLSRDGQRWIASREKFFLPVRVLSLLFRGKFLAELKSLYAAGQLKLTGNAQPLEEPGEFQRLLDQLYRQSWVVYAKPPFGGAEQVYRYLGRYTHRVAISNRRLESFEHGKVSFRYKDYADDNRIKTMRLDAEEFIRRFLLHVLPSGLVRIRHYGLLAAANVNSKLAKCFELLEAKRPNDNAETPSAPSQRDQEFRAEPPLCPKCRVPMQRVELPVPTRPATGWPPTPVLVDSS